MSNETLTTWIRRIAILLWAVPPSCVGIVAVDFFLSRLIVVFGGPCVYLCSVAALPEPVLPEILRYLFFLRVPILFGVLLYALPVLCTRVFPTMLGNLGESRGLWQNVATMFAAWVAGMAISKSFVATLNNAEYRFAVRGDVPSWFDSWLQAWFGAAAPTQALGVAIFAVVLALPTVIWVLYSWWTVRQFPAEKAVATMPRPYARPFFMIGLVGIASVVSVIPTFVGGLEALLGSGARVLSHVLVLEGYFVPGTGQLQPAHAQLILFLAVVFVVYLAGYWLLRPGPDIYTPALFLLLLLITNSTLLLSGAAFFLDYFRFPLLLAALLWSVVWWSLTRLDHYFQVYDPSDVRIARRPLDSHSQPADNRELLEALGRRLANQEADKTLVVVAAAGGGIQASAWTAKVLASLDGALAKKGFPPLTPKIGFISGASGGSVGSMFFVHRMPANAAVDEEMAQAVVHDATRDNVDAIAWGMAYPDFWRLNGFGWLLPGKNSPHYVDRGTALEEDWHQVMTSLPAGATTGVSEAGQATSSKVMLSDWRKDMLAGKKPVTVFNAINVDEKGGRLLLSPLPVSEAFDEVIRDDPEDPLSGYDLPITTAARLSATFPFVTPIARANQPTLMGHVADSGYIDNFGVVTVVNLLEHLRTTRKEPDAPAWLRELKRIVVLEIRGFKLPPGLDGLGDGDDTPAWASKGWLLQVVGPLLAMINVRRYTQVKRNTAMLDAQEELWNLDGAEGLAPVAFRRSTISFPCSREQYVPPLSWKLSERQKQMITNGWEEYTATQYLDWTNWYAP